MPIRINLLAEAQAAEEQRRNDPVKRAIWVGAFCVCLVLLWMFDLQFDIFFAQKNYDSKGSQWKSISAKYAAVTNNSLKIGEIDRKLAALDRLHTNRFLWAPVLNALQKTVVDNVQLSGIRTEDFMIREEGHDIVSGINRIHVPPTMVEKISLYLDGRDNDSDAQDYNKYKETLAGNEFFVSHLGRKDGFLLDSLGTPSPDPANPPRQFVTFVLASHFPEARRSE